MHVLNSASAHYSGVTLRTTHGKKFSFNFRDGDPAPVLPFVIEAALNARKPRVSVVGAAPGWSGAGAVAGGARLAHPSLSLNPRFRERPLAVRLDTGALDRAFAKAEAHRLLHTPPPVSPSPHLPVSASPVSTPWRRRFV